jgi:hypothetical protein
MNIVKGMIGWVIYPLLLISLHYKPTKWPGNKTLVAGS